MRARIRTSATAIILAGAVAAVTAVTAATAEPNGMGCKVLLKALHGTAIGFHAKHLVGGDSGDCVYADGATGPTQWGASLGLSPQAGSVPAVKLYCKGLLADRGGYDSGAWLVSAKTGADAGCWRAKTAKTHAPAKPYRNTTAEAVKGRWSITLVITTPPSGGGGEYIAFLLKQITKQLH